MKTVSDMKNTEIRISVYDLVKLDSSIADVYPDSMTRTEMRETVVSVSEWELRRSVPSSKLDALDAWEQQS